MDFVCEYWNIASSFASVLQRQHWKKLRVLRRAMKVIKGLEIILFHERSNWVYIFNIKEKIKVFFFNHTL